jgi:SAM-dependent methyltransferase
MRTASRFIAGMHREPAELSLMQIRIPTIFSRSAGGLRSVTVHGGSVMGKQAEIDYVRNLTESEVRHAVDKPFSDPQCSGYMFEIAAVMSLLPPPPARLIDFGCGTGWTSRMFAKRGYQVTGVDIAPDFIVLAREAAERDGLGEAIAFQTLDYEDADFRNEFDCAVFFDSLHHAVDERKAVEAAFRALKPEGVCVASEPGTGHAAAPGTQAAVDRFGVTEKDTPPKKIIMLGRQAGFRSFQVFPHAFSLDSVFFRKCVEFSPQADSNCYTKRISLPQKTRKTYHAVVRAILGLTREEPSPSGAADSFESRYQTEAQNGCRDLLRALDDSGLVRMVK